MRVGTLVDVEVVIGGQRRHPQVDGVGCSHLLQGIAGQPFEDLARGGLNVEAHRLDGTWEVVIRGQVTVDELENWFHLFADRREDELVAPDGMPAELALIRVDSLGNKAPAAFAHLE